MQLSRFGRNDFLDLSHWKSSVWPNDAENRQRWTVKSNDILYKFEMDFTA